MSRCVTRLRRHSIYNPEFLVSLNFVLGDGFVFVLFSGYSISYGFSAKGGSRAKQCTVSKQHSTESSTKHLRLYSATPRGSLYCMQKDEEQKAHYNQGATQYSLSSYSPRLFAMFHVSRKDAFSDVSSLTTVTHTICMYSYCNLCTRVCGYQEMGVYWMSTRYLYLTRAPRPRANAVVHFACSQSRRNLDFLERTGCHAFSHVKDARDIRRSLVNPMNCYGRRM